MAGPEIAQRHPQHSATLVQLTRPSILGSIEYANVLTASPMAEEAEPQRLYAPVGSSPSFLHLLALFIPLFSTTYSTSGIIRSLQPACYFALLLLDDGAPFQVAGGP